MSSNLTMEPANRSKLHLSTDLKFALRKLYGEPVNIHVTYVEARDLKALAAADVPDAKKALDYFEKHGECILKEEY